MDLTERMDDAEAVGGDDDCLRPLVTAGHRGRVHHALERVALVRHRFGHQADSKHDGVELVARAERGAELTLDELTVLVRATTRRVDHVDPLAQLVPPQQLHRARHLSGGKVGKVNAPAKRGHVYGELRLQEGPWWLLRAAVCGGRLTAWRHHPVEQV